MDWWGLNPTIVDISPEDQIINSVIDLFDIPIMHMYKFMDKCFSLFY